MAGYSGTPLPKKLGIKPDHRVGIVGAPRNAGPTLAEIAATGPVELKLSAGKPFDVIVIFCNSQKDLADRFPKAHDRLDQAGGLWVAWPKKSSGIETDLNENVIRNLGLAAGLVDNKVCAIDDTWSGLRFVIRLADRTKPVSRGVPAPVRNPRTAKRTT